MPSIDFILMTFGVLGVLCLVAYIVLIRMFFKILDVPLDGYTAQSIATKNHIRDVKRTTNMLAINNEKMERMQKLLKGEDSSHV